MSRCSRSVTSVLAAAAMLLVTQRSSADPPWGMRFTAEAVVPEGTPLPLNPDDKELCVPSKVRIRVQLDRATPLYVFRVHAANKSLTMLHFPKSGSPPARTANVEVSIDDAPDSVPNDGVYVVAAERELSPDELRAAARKLGPLRTSPEVTTRAAGTVVSWIWKGRDSSIPAIWTRAVSLDGVAAGVFKFRRATCASK